MLYLVVFEDRPGTVHRPGLVVHRSNQLTALAHLQEVLHVARTPGLLLHSDVTSQRLVVQFAPCAAPDGH